MKLVDDLFFVAPKHYEHSPPEQGNILFGEHHVDDVSGNHDWQVINGCTVGNVLGSV